MNDGVLVRKNLFRKPLRTALLVISIFVAFLLFGLLGSFYYTLNLKGYDAAANRLITINKVTFTQPLPLAYLGQIRRIQGVVAASPMHWFGGYYQNSTQQIQTFPVEPESFLDVYQDIVLPDDQREAFLNTRTGIIVGRSIAEQYGFQVGQRIPLHSDIYTNRTTGQQVWEFDIVGIFDAADPNIPTNAVYFDYELFRESVTFNANTIGWVAIKTEGASVNDDVAARIDTQFKNSLAETKTQDELAFGRSFLAQMGNISFVIMMVVGAAFVAILMVVGNTMMMTVRERTREIGVLKTLGFTDGRVVRMVLSESVLLALLGAGLGLGIATLLMMGIPDEIKNMFGGFSMELPVFAVGVTAALTFGLITGFAPAWNALNLKIVEALGRK